MPKDPEPARQRLLDAALVLFADKGIANTSLREIRLQAGQSNNFAAQYHFGDKDGLLRHLLQREIPQLVDRRAELLADAADAWSYAAVWVLPFAELATGEPRQRHIVQLLSQLHDDVTRTIEDVLELTGDTGVGDALTKLRAAVGAERDERFQPRLVLAINSFIHAAALRARQPRRFDALDDASFRTTLVDMFLGAVAAERSPSSRP